MKSRPTVIDVAAAADVGASTVSRFLRGVPVRSEFAARISTAINKLGYQPDQTARSLRGGRSRTVGVLFPRVSTVYFSQALQCVEILARQRDYIVALLTHGDKLALQQQCLQTLRSCHAEGIILSAAPGTTLELIQSTVPGTPVVALDNFFSSEIDSILLQNRESARHATEHLLGHGYVSISCIGARTNVFSYQQRVAGYSDAMTARGLKPHVLMAADFDNLLKELRRELTRKRPAALLALSDVAAGHVLAVCQELGIPPQKRPKMIAYDDFEFASMLQTPLTVVRQPIADMVQAAMASLFRQIDGDTSPKAQTVAIAGELVVRSSCGCG